MGGQAHTAEPSVGGYPGEGATAHELWTLAEEYKRSAGMLLDQRRPGVAISQAPFRMVAIHAIELYLSAFLRASGKTAAEVRSLGHNLAARDEIALSLGLVLRRATRLHLAALSMNREYLVSRYGAELLNSLSQLNRIDATLNEIATKVTSRLLALDEPH